MMAPGFLSKLVKPNPSPSNSRENSRRSFDSIRRGRSPSPALPTTTTTTAVPKIVVSGGQNNFYRGRDASTARTSRSPSPASSGQPIVTIVPPSPRSTSRTGWSNSSDDGARNDSDSDIQHDPPQIPAKDEPTSKDRPISSITVTSTISTSASDDATTHSPKPTSTSTNPVPLTGTHSRTLSPASSTGNLRELVQQHASTTTTSVSSYALTLELPSLLRRKTSNKSIKLPPLTSTTPEHAITSPSVQSERSSTEDSTTTTTTTTTDNASVVVDSPTSLSSSYSFNYSAALSTATIPTSSRIPESDAASIRSGISANTAPVNSPSVPVSPPAKKRTWRRGSTPSRKPTGLAGAIAASGMTMAMANASMAVPQLMLPTMQQTVNGTKSKAPVRKVSGTGFSTSSLSLSANRSPRTPSSSSRKTHSRRTSTSIAASVGSENNSEIYVDDREYSGLEGSSSGGSDSSDDLGGLDIGEDDIPVTGFAVASNKRNADFHELFHNIPDGDYLIEDYGCALQREILIQGRLYISENHICFHSNIFGWVTDLSIPVFEVTALEKKMTAFVIPNAIQVTTPRTKYTFSSLLARDTTYDVIYNVWRIARPGDSASFISSTPVSVRGSLDEGRRAMEVIRPNGIVKDTAILRKATQCECGRTGGHFSETALETILPGTPDRIHNLMFASGFMKDFMKDNQKLLDIQISDWSPVSDNPSLLARNMSYIRPLTASIGPKQTKCEIRDETLHCDFDDYIVMLTTARTPDVPSGGVFAVKTRTCIMWASGVSTRVIVTTQVEWTGRSFIKGIIEKSAIDGQKTSHADLDKAMRAYIQQHQSEFVPAGVDPAVLPTATTDIAATTTEPAADEPSEGVVVDIKQREHERNLRGLQWAWDTFEGASQVARQSARGAIELVAETWEQSTSTTICIAIIILLVFSNLWTLLRMGGREELGRLKELRKMEEKEKWVQGIVTALWDELASGKSASVPSTMDNSPLPPIRVPAVPSNINLREEVAGLSKTLDDLEERLSLVRDSLNSLD